MRSRRESRHPVWRRAAMFVVAASITSGATIAAQPPAGDRIRRYVSACALLDAAEPHRAAAEFRKLALENPAWMPPHAGLAVAAIASGGEARDEARHAMKRRTRQSSRDVGAAVAHAVFLLDDGDGREATRVLLSAIGAGARDPTLVSWLLLAEPGGRRTAEWLARRAAVLPRDASLAAMRAELLLRTGRIATARRVAERALKRSDSSRDLIALHVELLRAFGEESDACRRAELALGLRDGATDIPAVKIPRRIRFARALVSCDRAADAARMLGSAGSTATVVQGRDLDDWITLARAEIALAQGRPLDARRLLASAGEVDAPLLEMKRYVSLRAAAVIGAPGSGAREIRAATTLPLPRGAALADRGAALAAAAAIEPHAAGLVASIRKTARAQDQAGLVRRAARLRVLSALLRHEAAPRSIGTFGAELRAAEALARAAMGLTADRPELEWAGAPGALLAPLHVLMARMEIAAGNLDAARDAIRAGYLDLQEADRSSRTPAAEFLAAPSIALDGADVAASLAGLSFLAARGEDAVKANEALRMFGRLSGSWSVSRARWPDDLATLAASLPTGACFVFAPGGLTGIAVSFDAAGVIATSTADEALNGVPCRAASTVYWLGLTPEGGLVTPGAPRRVLVRLTGPTRERAKAGTPRIANVAEIVTSGADRPYLRIVEAITGEPTGAGSIRAGRRSALAVYSGRGVALSRAPLASGWLVPVSVTGPPGFLGAAEMSLTGGPTAQGLMALGVRMLPPRGPERGAWLLAESALVGGRPWVLESRRPLDGDEIAAVLDLERVWRRDPLEAARTLALENDRLAHALSLWTSIDSSPLGGRPTSAHRHLWLLGIVMTAVLVAWVTLRSRRRRVDA